MQIAVRHKNKTLSHISALMTCLPCLLNCWIEKISPTCVSTSQMNFIVLRGRQSGTKTWCRLELISRIISVPWNKSLLAACKQNLDGDKNNPRICGASVTNFQLTLAWAKENFPVSRDFFGAVEPEISIFGENAVGNNRPLRVIPCE